MLAFKSHHAFLNWRSINSVPIYAKTTSWLAIIGIGGESVRRCRYFGVSTLQEW
jgi:hypothetical protein